MGKVLVFLAAAIVGLVLFFLWASSIGTLEVGRRQIAAVQVPADAPIRSASSTVTVMSWNIAWAFGRGSELAADAPEKPPEDIARNLQTIAETIIASDADIVLLQEVDFDAARSYHVDQARALAELTEMPFFASVVSWDVNYLPYPYWPPWKHAGKIRSGGAILSRWRLSACWRDLFAKPTEQPFWYSQFYLFRYMQYCRVDRPGVAMEIVNVHLEAFDRDTRMKQAQFLADRLSTMMSPMLILGGDMNSPPPEAEVKSGYPDEPETDHTGDTTIDTIRRIEGLRAAVENDDYRRHPEQYFTFPAHEPNRTLDHVFVGRGYRVLRAHVPSVAGDPSDHLPVVVELLIPR
jgi:endonuclease/exonuclease/phosphatase family metal-dependent hydrolase